MTFWSSLYLPCADALPVVEAARDSLTALGYILFNPFGLLPGPAYPQAARLFVAPARSGWVRVVGQPDTRQLPLLSRLAPLLSLTLDGSEASIRVFQGGDSSTVEALAPWLRPGRSAADLSRIATTPDLRVIGQPEATALPLDALPAEVQSLAGSIDLKRAQKMFARMTGDATRRGGTDDGVASAARGLIAAGNPPDWDSAGGRRLQALMGCLTVPADWRAPDFTTLRDAYQVSERRQRRPGSSLYPGDAEALAAVPDALDYAPVYGGSR